MQQIKRLYKYVTKYQHVERLGSNEVQGILNGEVWVQEKIDGANLSIAWDKKEKDFIICSRNNVIYKDGKCSNTAFERAVNFIKNNNEFEELLTSSENNIILRCEYLTKHKIPFKKEFEGTIAIYDVERIVEKDDNELIGTYLHGEEFSKLVDTYKNLPWVSITTLTNPSIEKLVELSEEESHYADYREGVVVKNYSFINVYGRTKWAKVISKKFDASRAPKPKVPIVFGKIEKSFVEKYVTKSLVEKEILKIELENGSVSIKDMGKLIGVLPYELFQDEMWRFLLKNKIETINFPLWKKAVSERIKEYALEYFNTPK